jgi:hypothetical protein
MKLIQHNPPMTPSNPKHALAAIRLRALMEEAKKLAHELRTENPIFADVWRALNVESNRLWPLADSGQTEPSTEAGEVSFWISTLLVEVLSDNGPIGSDYELSDIHSLISDGPCVGNVVHFGSACLKEEPTAEALYVFGSDPGFFQLDDENLGEADSECEEEPQ